MSKLFQNSGVLFLVMLSFFVTHTKQEIKTKEPLLSQVALEEKPPSQEVIDQATRLYVASSTPVESQPYGVYTQEIEQVLNALPSDSEVYIEEREGGKWYLKVEKLFGSDGMASAEMTPTTPQDISPPPSSGSMDEPKFMPPNPIFNGGDTLLV